MWLLLLLDLIVQTVPSRNGRPLQLAVQADITELIEEDILEEDGVRVGTVPTFHLMLLNMLVGCVQIGGEEQEQVVRQHLRSNPAVFEEACAKKRGSYYTKCHDNINCI